MDLVLNNLKRFIRHENKPIKQTKIFQIAICLRIFVACLGHDAAG